MSNNTKIEWTDSTWTPIRARVRTDAAEIARSKGYTSLVQIAAKQAGRVGAQCERCSEGCDNCYSETFQSRCLPHNGTGLPFDRRSRDLVEYFLDEEVLLQPLKWRKPRKVFVCSQTDLFGEWVPDEWIDQVFAVMALCPHVCFQILTKRADRMEGYMNWLSEGDYGFTRKFQVMYNGKDIGDIRADLAWPLPNVHLGVSVENQEQADKRIPHLLRTPAAVRFLSVEPLLGPVDIWPWLSARYGCEGERAQEDCEVCGWQTRKIDWVIVGGESGPGARPMHPDWARSLRDQCQAAGVPFFFKQWGAYCHPLQMTDDAYMRVEAGDISMVEWDQPVRLGKKTASRLLDGREWNEFPEAK